MDDNNYLEEVRCRGCLGVLGVALRNHVVYHDLICASEPFPANVLNARDALIENLVLSGDFSKADMAALVGVSRQRIEQILKSQRP